MAFLIMYWGNILLFQRSSQHESNIERTYQETTRRHRTESCWQIYTHYSNQFPKQYSERGYTEDCHFAKFCYRTLVQI